MMLSEQTTVPLAALPIDAFKDHLRLGTGFADDGAEDALLETLMRASIAAVEARTGKALIARDFGWTLTAWRQVDRQALPVAPVRNVDEIRIIDRDDSVQVIAADRYFLERDTHRPRIGAPVALPVIPLGGRAELDFEAGFGPGWSAVPSDLAQAVFLLAAHYHEHRHATAVTEATMPFGVLALLERWRTVRVLGGAGS